jgi:PAS domain S-box-containing protein
LTALDVESKLGRKKFFDSVESIFDAFFLLSTENQILLYGIQDEHIKLHFGEENLKEKDFIKLLELKFQRENINKLIHKIIEKKSSKFEYKLLVNDQIRFYEFFICTLSNYQTLITLTNIDHRKKIEFELAEERSTLKNIIDLNPYAIEIKDSEGRHVSANKAFIDMFKSVAPPDYSIFTDPHIKERGLLEKISKLKEGKVVRMGEHWYDVRDSAIAAGYNLDDYPSNPICHKAVAFPIFDREGNIKNFVFMHEDITKQKKAEEKLEESEQKYRHLFNSTPYAIWLVDLHGKIIDCNETMYNFMSILKPKDIKGESYKDVVKMFLKEVDPKFEILEEIFQERFKKLLEQGHLEPIEFEIPRAGDKTSWITLESSIVNMGKEKVIQVFIKDITERKLAEIELEELRKELETRVKERTIKLENSEKKYRKAYHRANCFKGLFTHDISNMFHTIGNSIDLCNVLLKQGIKQNDIINYFGVIEQQINRGKKLINNIRNLSEIEESEIALVPTEIFEKLRSAIQFVKINFQNREINIKIESVLDEAYVLSNYLLLDVFENILINSVLYNKNKDIEIDVIISKVIEKDIEYIKIEFKDNGIGINDIRKNVIFKENHRNRTGSKGMGLGLSLVAKLLDLCEGKIWVEDRIKGDYAQGSNFIVLIPKAE